MDDPLHPFLRAAVQARKDTPRLASLTLAQARAQAKDNAPVAPAPSSHTAILEISIPAPFGTIPVRVYVPRKPGTHPNMVFFHGGGFVLLDAASHDHLCLRLSEWIGCIVFSVDYRLAPEHRFPAAVDDALAATRWAVQHAGEFGGDSRQVAVAGSSAGACLAAVAAQRARDEAGPDLCAQLLIYPVTDYPTVLRPSYHHFGDKYGMTAEQMLWFWAQYLPDSSAAGNPHASPLRMASFAGLPPSYILLAQCDVLCDEGAAFASRLQRAGVDTTTQLCRSMNHGFLNYLGKLPEADLALRSACAWTRSAFDRALSMATRT